VVKYHSVLIRQILPQTFALQNSLELLQECKCALRALLTMYASSCLLGFH
jgi:hypothetical protein